MVMPEPKVDPEIEKQKAEEKKRQEAEKKKQEEFVESITKNLEKLYLNKYLVLIG